MLSNEAGDDCKNEQHGGGGRSVAVKESPRGKSILLCSIGEVRKIGSAAAGFAENMYELPGTTNISDRHFMYTIRSFAIGSNGDDEVLAVQYGFGCGISA
jgi:hypothetical protein